MAVTVNIIVSRYEMPCSLQVVYRRFKVTHCRLLHITRVIHPEQKRLVCVISTFDVEYLTFKV
jgi:hypothetical protein